MDIGALLQLLPVGGPISVLVTILVIAVKIYLDKRNDDREERGSVRQSESGIVETTNSALKLVREQMDIMGVNLAAVNAKNAELIAVIQQHEQTIGTLKNRINVLESENDRLQRQSGGSYFQR